ncbi:condensation domain-containing protein, partial [Paenibacillus chartarius]
LANHPQVTEAVVVVLEPEDGAGEAALCAYYTGPEAPAPTELAAFLGESLPHYMIPAHFVRLEQMPVTPNGKIDRKALPKPQPAETGTAAGWQPPQSGLEARLLNLWRRVLGSGAFGMNGNFFELGGHSLLAIKLLHAMEHEFQVEVPMRIVFTHPTVRQMADYLAAESGMRQWEAIPRSAMRDGIPLSAAQAEAVEWYTYAADKRGGHVTRAILIEGALDADKLQEAFSGLLRRHETLRTSFVLSDGEDAWQQVHEAGEFDLASENAREEELPSVIDRFVRPFDLERGPLLRVGIVRIADDRHVLLTDLHRSIADGLSTGILIAELFRLYQGEQLPALQVQYKDFVVWRQAAMQQRAMLEQEAYWLNRLAGSLPYVELPYRTGNKPVRGGAGAQLTELLEPKLSSELRELAVRRGATLYMVLLSAFGALLHKVSGQADIVIGTSAGGRNHPDTVPMIAPLDNALAIRVHFGDSDTSDSLLEAVKETVLQAFDHQDYPFELLQRKLRQNGWPDLHRPPFDVSFQLQNEPAQQLHSAGLTLTPYPERSSLMVALLAAGAVDRGERGIEIIFDYMAEAWQEQQIRLMLGQFVQLLEQTVHNPDMPLAELVLPAGSDLQLHGQSR